MTRFVYCEWGRRYVVFKTSPDDLMIRLGIYLLPRLPLILLISGLLPEEEEQGWLSPKAGEAKGLAEATHLSKPAARD